MVNRELLVEHLFLVRDTMTIMTNLGTLYLCPLGKLVEVYYEFKDE